MLGDLQHDGCDAIIMHSRPETSSRKRSGKPALCFIVVAGLAWQGLAWPVLAQDSSAASRIESDITLLAEDAMQGRGVGTAGLEQAAEFIAKRFEELGLKTDLAEGGPFQVFKSSTRVPRVAQGVDWEAIKAAMGEKSGTASSAESAPPDVESDDSPDATAEKPTRSQCRSVEARNVMALLPGEGSLADEIIIVGAHYDHLGYREKNGAVTVFNGANDNASGTAAVLEIARLLSEREQKLPRSVLFITFSAEEQGLVGSFFYVKHPVLPLDKTVAMVNLDMVGCMVGNQVMASGSGTSQLLTKMIIHASREHDLNLIEMPGAIGGSDHIAFYTHEVPVVHFITTGGWRYYHKPTDDVETVDCEGIARISQMVADLIVELAESEKRPKFKDSGWGGTIVRNLFRFLGAAVNAMSEPEEE